MLIGIMGKTGSGKSTIAKEINKDKKYLIISVDLVTHKLLENKQLKQEISKKYDVLENNQINRKKLAMILYNSPEELKYYNHLIWQYLEKELDQIIFNSTKPIIMDWMMLPLTKYYQLCNLKILVESDIKTRIERVLKRDNISKEHFILRDKNGLNYNKYEMDIIINNTKGVDQNEIKNIRKRITLSKR